jgi:hypothetical protein
MSTVTTTVNLIGKPTKQSAIKPGIGARPTPPVALDVLGLAAQIEAEKLASERAAWLCYRAILRTAIDGGAMPDLAVLRDAMKTLNLSADHVAADCDCLRREVKLTSEMNSATAKATALQPETVAANQRVTDLEAELRVAQDEARRVGALNWSASQTSGERALDIRQLRESSPRMFAALK